MKKDHIVMMIGGGILAAWGYFWTFASAVSSIDFMRTSSGQASIGTFFLPPGLSSGLSVVGIGVMVYTFIISQLAISSGSAAKGKPTPSADLDTPRPVGNPKTLLPQALELPDGRSISSCTLEDLTAIFKTNTTDQVSRLLTGKWVKFPGSVRDNYGKGAVSLVNHEPLIRLEFGESWSEQLAELERGSSITVRGQIDRVSDSHIIMIKCELL